jgi:hypothetical protein
LGASQRSAESCIAPAAMCFRSSARKRRVSSRATLGPFNLLTFHCVSGSTIVVVIILRVDISVALDVEVMSPVKIGHFNGLGHSSPMEVGKRAATSQHRSHCLQHSHSHVTFPLGGNQRAPNYNRETVRAPTELSALCSLLSPSTSMTMGKSWPDDSKYAATQPNVKLASSLPSRANGCKSLSSHFKEYFCTRFNFPSSSSSRL